MEELISNGSCPLSEDVTAVQTYLYVEDGSQFPVAGNFRIRVGNEIMLVTAVTPAVGVTPAIFTVTRAIENTTAGIISAGTAVRAVLTAVSLTNFINQAMSGITSDRLENRPSGATPGTLFVPTDGALMYAATESGWQAYGPTYRFQPIDLSQFTWLNQGGSTWTQQAGVGHLQAQYTTGDNPTLLEQPVIGPTYSITLGFATHNTAANYNQVGICLHDIFGGRLMNFTCVSNDSMQVACYYTNGTSGGSAWFTWDRWTGGNIMFLRIVQDQETLSFQMSMDGVHFNNLRGITVATPLGYPNLWLNPTHVGIYIETCSVSGQTWGVNSMTAYHWEQVDPMVLPCLIPKGTRAVQLRPKWETDFVGVIDGYVDNIGFAVNGGANLVTNGDAETGDLTGWTIDLGAPAVAAYTATTGYYNGSLTSASPGPASRGSFYFYGSTSDEAAMHQNIDLTSHADSIDAGEANFIFDCWLGGLTTAYDSVGVHATFLDGSGNILRVIQIPPIYAEARGNVTSIIYRRWHPHIGTRN